MRCWLFGPGRLLPREDARRGLHFPTFRNLELAQQQSGIWTKTGHVALIIVTERRAGRRVASVRFKLWFVCLGPFAIDPGWTSMKAKTNST
jgi:hypothetical protein